MICKAEILRYDIEIEKRDSEDYEELAQICYAIEDEYYRALSSFNSQENVPEYYLSYCSVMTTCYSIKKRYYQALRYYRENNHHISKYLFQIIYVLMD